MTSGLVLVVIITPRRSEKTNKQKKTGRKRPTQMRKFQVLDLLEVGQLQRMHLLDVLRVNTEHLLGRLHIQLVLLLSMLLLQRSDLQEVSLQLLGT